MSDTGDSKQGLLNNWVVKNILGAVIFVVALAVAANLVLGVITRHNKTVDVPDFTNMQVSEASRAASAAGLRVEVTDSVFVRRMAKGAVFSQNPKAGTAVKSGRKIRLNINAVIPKKVTMPDLVGLSLRQAKAELSSKGLYLGKIQYFNDIATNNVLKQLYRNAEIRRGRSIESGSVIDLVVGLNETENMTNVPNVKGMRYLRAVDAIQNNSLNIGKLKFDESVKTYTDTLDAIVYAQSPGKSSCHMGSEVSLSLSIDPAKISGK